ncbi:MAG: AraC family transcriptional regulator [Candidatus Fimimorpha sp.]
MWNYCLPNAQFVLKMSNYVDLLPYQIGFEKCAPMHLFGPAKRNHYLLHFITSGKGTYQVGERIYSLHENQAFLIYPDVITTYYADSTHPWSYIWIEFDGVRAPNLLSDCGFSLHTPIYSAKNADCFHELIESLHYFLKYPNETSVNLIGHLYLFLDLLVKYSAHPRKSNFSTIQEYYIQEALHYIEQNYYKNLTIEEIALHCGLTRSYFSKLFKKYLDISPQFFLLHYRMDKACELLSRTSSPVNEIAKAIGYENPLHFSRAFKNIYQVSPRSYRNSHKFYKETPEH